MIEINEQVYDGVIIKPDLDDLLEHHGVKGQKCGIRKQKQPSVMAAKKPVKSEKKEPTAFQKWAAKEARKNVNRSIKRSKKRLDKRKAKGKEPISKTQLAIMTKLNRKRWNNPDLVVKY